MRGIDYSSGMPNLAAAKAAGYGFVVRYAATTQKGITKAEVDKLHASGLGIALVYESYAGRAKEGRVSGVADGKTALTNARAIGFPDSRPIYFAVDYNAPIADYVLIDAYLGGVASIIGASRVGVYGSYAVIEHCQSAHTAQWLWQTYAWSGGKISTYAHFRQYLNGTTVGGASVDLNETYKEDFGAWFKSSLSVAQQWAIDNGILNEPVNWDAPVTYKILAWALLKAKGKV